MKHTSNHSIPTKRCSRCKQDLPLSCFHKNKSRSDGHHSDCRACKSADYEKRMGGNPITVSYKYCSKCGLRKPASDFIRDRSSSDGLSLECKPCRRAQSDSEKAKRWRAAHLAQAKQTVHDYYVKNKNRLNSTRSKFNKQHRALLNEKRHRYAEANKEKVYLRDRGYRIKRKDKLNAWRRFNYATNPNYKLRSNLSSSLKSALRENKRFYRTEELLGCTISEFKAYFESKFLPRMSWNLFLSGKIWIDHVIPCSLFNMLDPTEVKQCYHYTNLVPMWDVANMKKSNLVKTSLGTIPATKLIKMCEAA